MNVTEALERIRRVGSVKRSGGKVKLKFPARERSALQPAIDILENRKAEALALLAEPLAERLAATSTEPTIGEPLESVLREWAIELWCDALGERLWIVADEMDAAKLGERRGAIYTAEEARCVIRIGDLVLVADIHRWKCEFDGKIRAIAPSSKKASR
jgi:hypothetical protein